MARYYLTKLKVEGFRGINNESDPLELRFKTDSVNSVFGVNAVGKSSIFEALSYAIKDSIPKLDVLRANESPEEYVCNKFHSRGCATIELEFESDDNTQDSISIRVHRDSDGKKTISSPSGHPDPSAFLATLNEDFTLLDYHSFSKFMDSTPLLRGRSFSALLGLSSYSDFRQALQIVSDTRSLNNELELTTLQRDFKSAEEMAQIALRRAYSSYNLVTGKEMDDLDDLEQYQTEVITILSSQKILMAQLEGKNAHEIDFEEINESIKTAEGGEDRKRLEEYTREVVEIEALGAPVTTLEPPAEESDQEEEHQQLTRLLEEKKDLLGTTRGDLFKQLYEAASAVLEEGTWTDPSICLLCESSLEIPINNIVKNQLEQYLKVTQKTEEIKEEWESISWIRRVERLEQAPALKIPENSRIVTSFNQKVENGSFTLEDLSQALDAAKEIEKKRESLLQSLLEEKERLEKILPPSLVALTEQVVHAKQFIEAITEYLPNKLKAESIANRLQIRERWKAFVNLAASEFSDAESDLSRHRISAIDSEYKSMFAAIMHDGNIVPELHREGSGEDLNVQLNRFHGLQDLSARPLLSESYRNALAISIFLSAALKHGGVPRFVVLDDVTSSFDSGHQFFLMDIIRRELQHPNNPDGLQFILLSHDGLLEKYFDRIGNTNDWHHQKLQGAGPVGVVMSHRQGTDRLRASILRFLSAGQINEATHLIRQYLEYKLIEIITKLNIPAPLDFSIKDHNKVVSKCLEVINQAVDLNRMAGTLVLEPQQVTDMTSIHIPALLGNWVSHYETGSTSSFTPGVLRGVIQAVDDFAECFKFDDISSGTIQRKWYRRLSSR